MCLRMQRLGNILGKVIVTSDNAPSAKEIDIQLVVKNGTAKNHGVNEPWKMTRLTWLNSTMAKANTVIAPYTPLQISGDTISLLGRKVILDDNGLLNKFKLFSHLK